LQSGTESIDRSSARSKATIVAIGAVAVAVVACYFGVLSHLAYRWSHEEDYSHGFLVPLFSGWLLWKRREMLALAGPSAGRWFGFALIAASTVLRWAALNFGFALLEPVALIVCLAGVMGMIGGWKMLHWSWPALLFLFFMIPLPGFLASRMSGPLQRIATISSTYVLQTLGVHAVASGNVIWLSQGQIGVVEACSGLRMLVMFAAVTVAAAFLLGGSRWERAVIILSSPVIAIASNVFRITATGLSQELISPEFAHKIFHDFAGWIMMPLAIGLLALERYLLAKLFPTVAVEPRIRVAPPPSIKRPAVVRNSR
jgi:exosortase